MQGHRWTADSEDDVNFFGLEFVSLTGNGANSTVQVDGTHGDDAIAAANLNAADRVWVNDRAVVSFATYGTLVLNGRFGDDTISVSPVALAAIVTAITVRGGDPSASDVLIVNGDTTPTADEAIRFEPTAGRRRERARGAGHGADDYVRHHRVRHHQRPGRQR